MSKGISPLVATVLLIAATMSIAGILAFWASQFVASSLPITNETQTTCKFADFIIYQCSYTASTGRVSVVLNNIRNVELKGLQAFVLYANGTSPPTSFNSTLAPGAFQTYTINGVSGDFNKIIISSNICTELRKEDACSRG